MAAHVLRVDRTWILVHGDEAFNELAGESLLSRRLQSEPLAYILGAREFYGRSFLVRPGVLIPRHETETAVELALEFCRPGALVLDIGTGSGCIAATLALEEPGLVVTAAEISEGALAVAVENFARLGANVELVGGDVFETIHRRYDLIVSNPPYISRSEVLAAEVGIYEPEAALFADENGLAFYRRLAERAGDWLLPEGVLVVEIGYDQAESVPEIFREWTLVKSKSDLIGHVRALAFRKL